LNQYQLSLIKYHNQERKEMADPQKRYRKMAPTSDRALIDKIDEALVAEGKGRQLWYWPAGRRLKASAVVAGAGGVRPIALTTLADELGLDAVVS
jgi:hypothetical protein